MKIAFIGTGLMGYPMAKNLINKKLNLKVFSRTLEKAKPLEKLGAIIVDSLGEAVKEADIVITMLTDDNAVEKVLSCLLYTSPSPRDRTRSRMPSSA